MPRMSLVFWVTATLISFLEVWLIAQSNRLHVMTTTTASKYSHAAVFPILQGYQLPDGTRHYPTVAMVANLAKATLEKPALMIHDDVVTFFHEMGHAFHGLLSKTEFSRFHGTEFVQCHYIVLATDNL